MESWNQSVMRRFQRVQNLVNSSYDSNMRSVPDVVVTDYEQNLANFSVFSYSNTNLSSPAGSLSSAHEVPHSPNGLLPDYESTMFSPSSHEASFWPRQRLRSSESMASDESISVLSPRSNQDFMDFNQLKKPQVSSDQKSYSVPQSPAVSKGKQEFNSILELAFAVAQNDIRQTCIRLGISPDPHHWQRDDVISWLRYTMHQFNVSESQPNQPIEDWAMIDGPRFMQLTEADFKNKLPEGGESICGQLEIWREASGHQSNLERHEQPQTLFHPCVPRGSSLSPPSTTLATPSNSELASRLQTLPIPLQPPSPYCTQIGGIQTEGRFQTSQQDCMMKDCVKSDYNQPQQQMDFGNHQQMNPFLHHQHLEAYRNQYQGMSGQSPTNSQSLCDTSPVFSPPLTTHRPRTPSTPSGAGRNNIHLWQFLKELLNHPQLYSSCIFWQCKEEGIFKIVDSVRLAYLWGKRKNRPAMNYDKMSRSMRQYYKKKILRKTERPQRLVYQFCDPYHR